jgi:hypothetical protein
MIGGKPEEFLALNFQISSSGSSGLPFKRHGKRRQFPKLPKRGFLWFLWFVRGGETTEENGLFL